MAMMISIVVILLTGSRGGFLSISIVFILWLIKSKYTLNFKYRMAIGLIAFALVTFNADRINFERYKTLLNYQNDYNMTDEFGRTAIWKTGLTLLLNNPLTGVGITCFDMAVGYHRQEIGILPKWQTAHNSIVEIGTETGFIGLLLYITINLKILLFLSKSKPEIHSQEYEKVREVLKFCFIGNFITSMFLSQAYSIYWVLFIASTSVMQNIPKNHELLKNNIKDRRPAIDIR